ncbi:MAG: SPFH domain-containing protein [bacterium]|nr:SPFH domain-containing protein [bacterium]
MLSRAAIFVLFAGVAVLLIGCESFVGVPPDYLGMILTPTGYEDHIYTPGQVDIKRQEASGMGNQLVLIQRSGLQIKEGFLGASASADKEDHRCLTNDKIPFTLDVRLMLALPDHETNEGKKDLKRLYLFGNPVVSQNNTRIFLLSSESIYKDQAQLQVRGAIRRICAQYQNFNDAFAAFASSESETSFNDQITRAVVHVLGKQQVPLRVIAIQISNLKPDDAVIEAQVALKAAEERVKAIDIVVDYIGKDPIRQFVYKMQVLQEIVNKAGTNGHNTIFLTDMANTQSGVLPLPMPPQAK